MGAAFSWALAALLCACSGPPLEPPPPPDPDPGACERFGVEEAAPIPERCPLSIPGEEVQGAVRVFAVGAHLKYRQLETYADFCSAWDTVIRTEVVPCLAPDRPNLLVLPENAALAAAFIGERGRAGREASSAVAGFASFFESYQGPYLAYAERYPEATPNQQLLLALGDTLHRAFQTFPEIARRYGVYLLVSSDLPEVERSTDPAEIERFGPPGADFAYVAIGPETLNVAVAFGPDGERLGRVAKSYLVPDEADLLNLVPGSLGQARPLALPFARLGVVISKDAWMPGLLHRLDALGANLMVQPEAFSGWAVEEYSGDWLPDVFTQSSYGHTQRHAAFTHNVTPCLKGNLLDLAYDCQSHIVEQAGLTGASGAFIGQDPYAGLVSVEPWVVEDPGPPLSLEERRARLREVGEKLLPGSGDPLEDAYTNHVVAADLRPGRHRVAGDGAPGVLGPSRLVAEPEDPAAVQRFPAVAADGDRVVLAFTEGAMDGGALRLAISDDGGRTFAISTLEPEGTRLPSVAAWQDRIVVAYEVDAGSKTQVVAAVSEDAGATFTRTRLSGEAGGWQPAAALDPTDGTPHVAYLDLSRGGHPRPYLATRADGDWAAVQVDPSNRATGARADAAFVAVAAAGGIVEVVFTDFRHGSWDVFRARSEDGGTTFAPAERIDPPAAEVTHRATGRTVEAERLHAYPAVVLNEAAPVILWSDLADRRRDTHVAWQQGGVTRRLDGAPPGRDAWRPAAAGDGARWFAVWQDLREGSSAVWLAADGVEVGRVSDLGPGGSAFAPQVAAGAQGVVVAWEDYRSGQARIRLSGPVTIEGP